jgi:hypothetical protein
MSLKIRYLDFWPNFQPENFLFTKALRSQCPTTEVVIVNNPWEMVDLEIRSVFTFKSLEEKFYLRSKAFVKKELINEYVIRTNFGYRPEYKTPAKRRIWYSGENLRPPQELFDGTISFDRSDSKANNLYFPLIYLGIDWFIEENSAEGMLTPEILTLPRTIRKGQLSRACSFATNLAPDRQRLVKVTSEIFGVDQFGKSVNRFVESKNQVAEKYVYQICNENSFYPGYVTEKLLDAWKAGNIAIWSGGLGTEIPINTDSLIDCTDLTEIEIENELRLLDELSVAEMLSAPMMSSVPTLEPLLNFLEEII